MESRTPNIPVSSQILVPSSKFGSPDVPCRSIVRSRLHDVMDGSDWRLALISGGAATGKTTFVSQWFGSLSSTPREWLTLDANDDRPDRFWLAFAIALERAAPDRFGRTIEMASDFDQMQFELLDCLLTEWSAAGAPLTLVLDDAHHIRNPLITRDLEMIVEHLPHGSHLVFTSRLVPSLPVASWRARSWLVEIRQRDLAFTIAETQSLFDALGEVSLDVNDVTRLWQLSEGWVAALRLASAKLRDSADLSAAVIEFSGSDFMVADLLAEELLSRQPEDISDFLLRTSVVGTLDVELCNALSGRNDSGSILHEMASQLQFVTAMGVDRQTFRYHPLLSELLAFELERRKPEEVHPLNRLAAAILEKRGDITGAVRHLLVAGEVDQVFSLVFVEAFRQYDRGEIATVEALVRLFPQELVEQSTFRLLTYALMLGLCGKAAEGVIWLQRAAVRMSDNAETDARNRATLDAILLLAFTIMGVVDDQMDGGHRAVEAVEAGLDLGVIGGRARSNLVRAHLLLDEVEDAETVLHQGNPGDEVAQLLIMPALTARLALRKGSLSEIERHARSALRVVSALNLDHAHYGAIDAHLALVGLYIDRNQQSVATEATRELATIMEHQQHALSFRVLFELERVRMAAGQRDLDEVFDILRQAAKMLEVVPGSALLHLVHTATARWMLESGDLKRANDLIKTLDPRTTATALLLARMDLLRDRPDLSTARLISRHYGCMRDQLDAELLLARVDIESGADDTDHLQKAVNLAVSECLVRGILDEGPTVARLARSMAASLGTETGDNAAAALGLPPRALSGRHQPTPLLTERELSVLRFIPTRLTNGEIATECNMSVNTVKTHLKSIYVKLDVSSRSEAVSRSQGLGLLK